MASKNITPENSIKNYSDPHTRRLHWRADNLIRNGELHGVDYDGKLLEAFNCIIKALLAKSTLTVTILEGKMTLTLTNIIRHEDRK